MKRLVVLIAAVLWYSVASVAATRDVSRTGEGIWWREVPTDTKTRLSPPGPHMVLTVPVSLIDVPAGVDSYKIACRVGRMTDKELQTLTAKNKDVRLPIEFGTGVATGNLSAATGNTKSVQLEAKVGIFLVPVGEDIEISDPTSKQWKRVKAADVADVYQCVLYLFSQSWGEAVRYLDPDAALVDTAAHKDPLPYQNGESAFPILASAKYQRVVTGRFLPAK